MSSSWSRSSRELHLTCVSSELCCASDAEPCCGVSTTAPRAHSTAVHMLLHEPMQAPWLRLPTPPPLPPPPTATVAAPPSPAPAKPQAKDHTVLAEAAFKELRCEWLAAMSHAM